MEGDESFKEKVRKLTLNSSEEEFNHISETLRNSHAMEEAYKISNHFLDKASHVLSTLNSSESREEFSYIIDKFYKR